jgi:transaldolase
VWYDNLSRDVLRSGALQKLISQGVSGLTSNPTIFKKSIADSTDYDTDVGTLSSAGANADQLCEDLMLQDVAAASDLLKPIFDASKGTDGHASIEVSPFLARDTKGTIEAAERLWSKLKRPNGMIKIPGTPEGLPAIRAALEKGINVNVTLLFNLSQYESVAEQYIAALEARVAKGLPVDGIASVASFFVSRVDAICEKTFDEAARAGKVNASQREHFFGKIGVANARVAYARFEQLFSGPRWEKLKAKGAKVQRPLWASTGTKNPVLNPLLYVEELAGAHTVNTMPPATLDILLKGGNIRERLHAEVPEGRALLASLPELHIPFEKLMLDLQNQGVELFAESYRELLASIEVKKKKVSGK